MAKTSGKPTSTRSDDQQPGTVRRGFVSAAMTVLIGGLTGLFPAVGGAIFALNPLWRQKSNDPPAEDEFHLVTRMSSLPSDGTPRAFIISGERTDAWTSYPEAELARVYLRVDQGLVICHSARCPHLGCSVNYQASQQKYICPCHHSSFSLNGTRDNAIPPRDLPQLAVEIRNQDEVWVSLRKVGEAKPEVEPAGDDEPPANAS